MRIEVGTSYLTRDGKRAQVQRMSGSYAYPFEGIIHEEDLDQEGVLWNKEGLYINRSMPDENDLVGAYQEKRNEGPVLQHGDTRGNVPG